MRTRLGGSTKKFKKLNREELKEAQEFAEDLAIARYVAENRAAKGRNEEVENLRFGTASEQQMEKLERYKEEELARLQSRDARRDMGQKEQTIERFHESFEHATRIYIDGKPRTLAMNQGRTDIKAVVPEDVARRKERDTLRVAWRAKDLNKLADRLLDRLKRDGVWQ